MGPYMIVKENRGFVLLQLQYYYLPCAGLFFVAVTVRVLNVAENLGLKLTNQTETKIPE